MCSTQGALLGARRAREGASLSGHCSGQPRGGASAGESLETVYCCSLLTLQCFGAAMISHTWALAFVLFVVPSPHMCAYGHTVITQITYGMPPGSATVSLGVQVGTPVQRDRQD